MPYRRQINENQPHLTRNAIHRAGATQSAVPMDPTAGLRAIIENQGRMQLQQEANRVTNVKK